MEDDRQWLARTGAMAAVLFAGYALAPSGSPDSRHGQQSQMQIRIEALPLAEGAPANAVDDKTLVELQMTDRPGSGVSKPDKHRMPWSSD